VNQEVNAPHGFVTDIFERDFSFHEEKINLVWSKLQRRETFTRGQLFPYRVEFAASSQEGEFSAGELNIHHGPFLSLHGAIGTVTSSYRGLDYFYGSYLMSFRFIRPVKLEFFREDKKIKVKVKAYVRPWMKSVWRLSNRILWFGFQLSMT
jgi:hypothetical protein